MAPPIVQGVLHSSGQPLDRASRVFFEPRFGHDFSKVRIHTDVKAAESARVVNALAYTVGPNVVFDAGKYQPETTTGKQLLGHELAHVVQQRGDVPIAQLRVGPLDDAYEREADNASRRLLAAPGADSDQGHQPVRGSIPPAHSTNLVRRVAPVSLQRACGPPEIGTPAGCTPLEGDIQGERFLFQVNCDVFQPGEEARLRTMAGTLTGGQNIGIHGFASEEGDPTFNEHLSCARALKAQQVINSVRTAAADAVNAQIFEHGPTPGNRDQQRSVVIEAPPVPPKPQPPQPGPNQSVNVTIAGGNELWFFGPGTAPPTYPLQQTLSANAAGLAGTFTWSVTGGAFALFDAPPLPIGLPFAFGPTVTLKSIAPSAAQNDVQVMVTFVGSGATGTATKNFTVQTAQSLAPTGNTHNAQARGYSSLIGYTVQDQFNTQLPRTIEVNEQWDEKPPVADFPLTNWPTFPPTEGHVAAPGAAFADNVGQADGVPPVLLPAPTAPSTPLGVLQIQHFRGHWQVGSPTIGAGKRVRTVIWRFFTDHGDHQFVSTP